MFTACLLCIYISAIKYGLSMALLGRCYGFGMGVGRALLKL